MYYTPEQEQKWNKVKEVFRRDTPIRVNFETWIEPMKLFAVTSTEVIVTFKDMLVQQNMVNRYRSLMENMVRTVFGMQYTFRVIDEREVEHLRKTLDNSMLNPKYTFDNFIVGSSNNFAYAASLAVAEQPDSVIYNPLFIYGDVGLGKTHLMNAIGNYIVEHDPTANIYLTTCERFSNELIKTILEKKGTPELRHRMRSVDILMVDDIQFLGKTNVAQEEFFHTFNELYNAGKQIIISSDRPPNEIPALEERLRTRFGSGLIVDVRRPDFETRVAILKKKADAEYIDIPYDCVEYIAAHFDKSIRELEGALTRIFAQSKLLGLPIGMELTVSALSSLITANDTRVITPKLIISVVAEKYGVTPEDILSKKRSREIAVPRQVAIHICRELTDLSTTNIGKEFGGRDHTTVMHSCEKVAEQIKADPSFSRRVNELIEQIRGA